MEIHKSMVLYVETPDILKGPHEYFRVAKAFAMKNYLDEVIRISGTKLSDITPEIFFREYIWTVHTTGFSAKAVSRFFERLKEAYGDYNMISRENFDDLFDRVKRVCNNKQKALSVHKTAIMMDQSINNVGWETFRNSQLSTPEMLQSLPYIGKVTCYHLGRNIGLLDCVKPDLHLVRMAKYWGFKNCEEMCKSIQKADFLVDGSEFPLGIIDLILWYSAATFGTGEIKQFSER